MSLSASSALHFNARQLGELLPSQGWQQHQLMQYPAQTLFQAGQLGAGISMTRSQCQFEMDYHCSLEYPSATLLLVFCQQGCSGFGFDTGQQRYQVQAGDVWLFQVRDPHLYRFTAAKQLNTMMVLKFDWHRLSGISSCLPVSEDNFAMRLAQGYFNPSPQLQMLCQNPLLSPLEQLMAEGLALQLLAQWLMPYQQLGSTFKLDGSERQAVSRVIECLVADLIQPPNLAQLALVAGMSHSRLNRIFRQAYGCTVFEWLRHYRLTKAEQMLQQVDFSITDIALACGFSSSSHFSSVFRQRYKMTPQQYRKQHSGIDSLCSPFDS